MNNPVITIDLSPDIGRDIDAACTRFEQAWNAGDHAPLEKFLEDADDSFREQLRLELIALEAYHRRKNGEKPTLEEYGQRFPDCDPLRIAGALADSGPSVESMGGVPNNVTELTERSPQIVGGYKILREIARGGMGIVYLAKQLELGRDVALKMILPGQLVTSDAVQRFRTEAKNVARLKHENIVPIFEVGEYQGQPFFSMKFVDGGSLDRQIGSFLSQPRAAARLLATVARALHHAHQHGLIHRDLKPSNILIDGEGQPHVTDFGLAKRLEASVDLTRSNAIVGTPCYMAPEQAAGRQHLVSTATDVYGLGAILYELLTGQPPFKADTPLDTLSQVLHQEPVPPKQRKIDVPRDLNVICLKCIEKEQARRYPSALALAEDLDRFVDGSAILARPVGTIERVIRWIRRNPVPTALIVVSFLASLALVGVLVASSYNARLEETNVQLAEALDTAREQKKEADHQRTLAEKGKVEADEQKARAEKERARARESEAAARRFFYVTRMTIANQADKEGNSTRVLQALRSVIPEAPDQEDLRGWEWHHLWRVHNGERSRLHGHKGAVTAVRFSPDDRLLASGGEDFSVRIWNSVKGDLVHRLTGHLGRVNAVAFDAEGKRLASCSDDRTIRVWDPHVGKELYRIDAHTDRVTGVAFCPKTGDLLSCSFDKAVHRWDANGAKIATYSGHTEPVHAVSVSSNGNYVASVSAGTSVKSHNKGTLLSWNVQRGLLEAQVPIKGSSHLAHNPVGGWLAFTQSFPPTKDQVDGVVFAQIAEESKLVLSAAFKEHTAYIRQLAFSMDGKKLATVADDQTLRVWDFASAKEIMTFRDDGPILAVSVSPDGLRYVSGGVDGIVKIWAGPQPDAREFGKARGGVAFSPDGLKMALSTGVFDVRTRAPVQSKVKLGANRISWSLDGRHLAGDGAIYDMSTGNLSRRLTDAAGKPVPLLCTALSADGSLVAGIKGHSGNDAVQLWETKTGRLVRVHKVDTWISCVEISPDGRWLLGGTMTQMDSRGLRTEWVKVWEMATGKEVRGPEGFRDCVWRLRFSPDGQYVAAAVGYHWASKHPGEVRVWKVGTWDLVWRLRGYEHTLYSIAFSSCGKRLATIGGKGRWEAKIWDLTTGQEVWTLHNPPKDAAGYDVAFSPCGRRLAFVGQNSSALLFDGTPVAETPRYEPMPEDEAVKTP